MRIYKIYYDKDVLEDGYNNTLCTEFWVIANSKKQAIDITNNKINDKQYFLSYVESANITNMLIIEEMECAERKKSIKKSIEKSTEKGIYELIYESPLSKKDVFCKKFWIVANSTIQAINATHPQKDYNLKYCKKHDIQKNYILRTKEYFC